MSSMALLPITKILSTSVCRTKGCYSFTTIRNLMSKQLVYAQFGDPIHVVKYKECVVPELEPHQVLVRMLAAPVNPADINTIQGKYPVKISLPMVPGNEGVGVVEGAGKDVVSIYEGMRVIVTKPALGTWRDYAVFHKDTLKVVPNELGLVEAATITVNPCTAYRMLTDFKPVREKNLVVIQNGANSACGQNVIQICKAWGIRNIGIIRDRPKDLDKLKNYLKILGATYVLTDKELRTTNIFKEIEKPSLALNCVGGKNALEMLRYLDHNGAMVTYGGMSREPVTIPTAAFIFKNLQFYGFWMTRWNETNNAFCKDQMLNEVIQLMCEGKLKAPLHKLVKFNQFEEALGNALAPQGFLGMKYILDFNE